jgi:hypothetical protein
MKQRFLHEKFEKYFLFHDKIEMCFNSQRSATQRFARVNRFKSHDFQRVSATKRDYQTEIIFQFYDTSAKTV